MIIQNITYFEPYNPAKKISDPTYQSKILKGSDCFKIYYDILRSRYHELLNNYITGELKLKIKDAENIEISIEKMNDYAKSAYESFFTKYQSDIGHYFRTMYNIIRFIKENNLDHPRYYTNLIRAQLSSYEHLMLFYNCHSKHGENKFKPLVEEFSLLNNMPQDLLLDRKHTSFYSPKAYT